MARIYGKKVNVDLESVKNFFSDRAITASSKNCLSATMYQPEEVAIKRDLIEKQLFQDLINLKPQWKVLDMGCGTGRWADYFHNKSQSYLGFDNSLELIQLARNKYKYDSVSFQLMSVVDIDLRALAIAPPYNIILITGVLVYVNDTDIKQIFEKIIELSDEETYLYIREPVSVIEERITLHDFYSEELNANYNAIYRTDDEYKLFFEALPDFELIREDFLYDQSLHDRKETQHKYYLLQKIS